MPTTRPIRFAILLLAAALGAAPAMAAPPAWAGGGNKGGEADDGPHGKGKGKDKDKASKHEMRAVEAPQGGPGKNAKAAKPQRADVRVGSYFSDRDRTLVRTYYGEHYGPGAKSCPPGLAKKNNGCLPPGQARKWAVGQPLPAGVVLYSVPQPVLVQLPVAPAGYRYVRVASDILLIAVGSRMVIDGMTDLLRM
jgi:Ni/Co efflux regulator RcnB